MARNDILIATKTGELIAKFKEREAEIIDTAVRENAVPSVKGEITLGKLRWRGIYLCIQPSTQLQWMEQRGKRISEKFSYQINLGL